MEMNHTGLFNMHQEPEVLDENTMDYWMERVELAQSIQESKRIMKQFEAHRQYLAAMANSRDNFSTYCRNLQLV